MNEVMRIRTQMAAEGWWSNDFIGWDDAGGFSILFSRWDWHGRRVQRAGYHAHTPDLARIHEAAQQAAELARRALHDFPDSPPLQENDQLISRRAFFDEGEAARKSGKPISENPHASSHLRNAWRDGWMSADDEFLGH